MTPDRNVTPYVKLNEVIETVNEHTAYFRLLDALLLEMASQTGVWGWLTRLCFAHFFATRVRMISPALRFIDVPPIIPNTLEIQDAGKPDSSGNVRGRGARKAEGSS